MRGCAFINNSSKLGTYSLNSNVDVMSDVNILGGYIYNITILSWFLCHVISNMPLTQKPILDEIPNLGLKSGPLETLMHNHNVPGKTPS